MSTTIASGSNGFTLPQSTIFVLDTTGFTTSGRINVTTSQGVQLVSYSNKTATSFTGCVGGIGTMNSGNPVTLFINPFVPPNPPRTPVFVDSIRFNTMSKVGAVTGEILAFNGEEIVPISPGAAGTVFISGGPGQPPAFAPPVTVIPNPLVAPQLKTDQISPNVAAGIAFTAPISTDLIQGQSNPNILSIAGVSFNSGTITAGITVPPGANLAVSGTGSVIVSGTGSLQANTIIPNSGTAVVISGTTIDSIAGITFPTNTNLTVSGTGNLVVSGSGNLQTNNITSFSGPSVNVAGMSINASGVVAAGGTFFLGNNLQVQGGTIQTDTISTYSSGNVSVAGVTMSGGNITSAVNLTNAGTVTTTNLNVAGQPISNYVVNTYFGSVGWTEITGSFSFLLNTNSNVAHNLLVFNFSSGVVYYAKLYLLARMTNRDPSLAGPINYLVCREQEYDMAWQVQANGTGQPLSSFSGVFCRQQHNDNINGGNFGLYDSGVPTFSGTNFISMFVQSGDGNAASFPGTVIWTYRMRYTAL